MQLVKITLVLAHLCFVFGDIEERLLKLEKQMASMKEHISHQDALIDHLNKVISNSANVTSVGRRSFMTSAAAFTALMDHVIESQPAGHPLVFNKVLTNEGGAYNRDTGIFTAPQDGIYIFSYSMHVNRDGQSFLQLVRNGAQVVGSVTESFEDYGDTQGGSTAVISLFANDEVWVEVFHDKTDRLEGKYGGTSFTGAWLM